jgi:hypothetical protein
MKTYTAYFTVNVPNYGKTTIEAATAAEAITKACAIDPTAVCDNPDRSQALCGRVIRIIDDKDDHTVAEDLDLDDAFVRHGGIEDWLLCEAAPEMLQSLRNMIVYAHELISAVEANTHEFKEQAAALSEAMEEAAIVIHNAQTAE